MTLAEDLAVQAAKSRAAMPDEFWAIIDENTARLAREGLAESCLQESDAMPAFVLSNAVGEQISSADKLASGPLIVSFYRGGW
jgi:hypothetical protein